MSATKHTPGPWCVEDPLDFELTIVEAGKPTHEWRFIASCSLPDGDDDQAFTGHEVRANAYLIASAPDLLNSLAQLLEALQSLISSSAGVAGLHQNGDMAPWSELTQGGRLGNWLGDEIEAAEAAIAKATQS